MAPDLTTSKPSHNGLLAALPLSARQRLAPELECVELPAHHVLFEADSALTHAFFPTTAIISLLQETEDGGCAASALVGNDGMVGISLLMGGGSTSSRAVVQCRGEALRVGAQHIRAEFRRGGATMDVLLRYTQALLTEMAQKAICSRRHTVCQQLSRCLLLSLDRTANGELISMTHEQIANLIGVRREGISESAMALQRKGVIEYRRGRILVRDRRGLEEESCDCYATLSHECRRLLPQAIAA
jgi:CRP-like cAMP-binding protein